MEILRVGDLTLNVDIGEVRTNSTTAQLTPTETDILRLLMIRSPWFYKSMALRDEIWPMPPMGVTAILRVYIWKIRQKIEEDPAHPRRLLSRPRWGYRIVEAVLES